MKAACLLRSGTVRGPYANLTALTANAVNPVNFTMQTRDFGLNRKTTFKRLPGMSSDEMHANYAHPGEKEEGSIDYRSWKGKHRPEAEEIPFGEWTIKSKRCGAIARKIGMMNTHDARGVRLTLTVLRMEENQVVEIRKKIAPRTKERQVNILMGAGNEDVRNLNKGQMIQFRRAGIAPKEKLIEFPVSLDALLPVGTSLNVRHFVPGQFVDIISTSKDKGFQGVMKRWGFKGQRATHGVSLTHRQLGSTGACQNPGRIWKGKKMAGHMGNNRCTFFNMKLYKIDVDRNLLFLMGSVPGQNGSWVELKDAARRPFIPENPPPFPTFDNANLPPGQADVNEIVMDVSHLQDPFAYG